MESQETQKQKASGQLKIFLCGDISFSTREWVWYWFYEYEKRYTIKGAEVVNPLRLFYTRSEFISAPDEWQNLVLKSAIALSKCDLIVLFQNYRKSEYAIRMETIAQLLNIQIKYI